jgi:hypothetical protein
MSLLNLLSLQELLPRDATRYKVAHAAIMAKRMSTTVLQISRHEAHTISTSSQTSLLVLCDGKSSRRWRTVVRNDSRTSHERLAKPSEIVRLARLKTQRRNLEKS